MTRCPDRALGRTADVRTAYFRACSAFRGRLAAWGRSAVVAAATLTMTGLVGPVAPAAAQPGDLDEIVFFTNDRLAPHGLMIAWQTQVRLDASKGRVREMTYFVSERDGYVVYELTNPPESEAGETPVSVDPTAPPTRLSRPVRFSERDINAFRRPIGEDRARELAIAAKADLEAQGTSTNLVRRFIPKTFLAVVTSRGICHCFDAETGQTLWAVPCGGTDQHVFAPAIGEKFLAVVSGTHLFVFARDTGVEVIRRQTLGVPSAGPVVSDTQVAVPMFDGSLEYYSLAPRDLLRNGGDPQFLRSTGAVMVTPQHAGTAFAWATAKGYLYVGDADKARTRFGFPMTSPASSSPLFVDAETLIASTVDGYVYSVGAQSGSVNWRFSSGGEIRQTPLPIGSKTYVPLYKGGLFEVDTATGAEGWFSDGIQQVLAATDDRIFAYDVFSHLVVLDRATGQRLSVIPVRQNGLTAYNTSTDRMFFSTPGGRLFAIHGIYDDLPIVHRGVGTLPPGAQSGPAAKPATPAASAPADPFGAPASDPFATPAAMDDPFGTPAAPSARPTTPATPPADPFGLGDPFGAPATSPSDRPGSAPADPFGLDDPFGS